MHALPFAHWVVRASPIGLWETCGRQQNRPSPVASPCLPSVAILFCHQGDFCLTFLCSSECDWMGALQLPTSLLTCPIPELMLALSDPRVTGSLPHRPLHFLSRERRGLPWKQTLVQPWTTPISQISGLILGNPEAFIEPSPACCLCQG